MLTASETQSVLIAAGSMAGMHVADMVLETYLRVPFLRGLIHGLQEDSPVWAFETSDPQWHTSPHPDPTRVPLPGTKHSNICACGAIPIELAQHAAIIIFVLLYLILGILFVNSVL